MDINLPKLQPSCSSCNTSVCGDKACAKCHGVQRQSKCLFFLSTRSDTEGGRLVSPHSLLGIISPVEREKVYRTASDIQVLDPWPPYPVLAFCVRVDC
jgi:hypothetical protein